MARPLLTFPNPVNDVAARTVATGVVVMAVVAVAARQPWLTIPLAYGFVARVLTGPRLSPLGQLATRLVAPRLPGHAKLVPGPPKRFAQMIGAAFTLGALSLWLDGHATGAYVVLALLAVPAFLEAALGYCVGCQLFSLGMRVGLVPASTCRECADIWGPAAAAQRSAGARS
ncbi:MAG TPA: DUF4395 domain-containing protein [Acidimicrobiales bacterium]|nr:DUF4395 domain-containing protein [Acidimicrobiales bacterium]